VRGHAWQSSSQMIIVPTEDDKVSLDDLQEKIAEFEDYVQSTDVAAMQSKSVWFLQIHY
jgi:hypothetical protein